jgi:hypothetical protein
LPQQPKPNTNAAGHEHDFQHKVQQASSIAQQLSKSQQRKLKRQQIQQQQKQQQSSYVVDRLIPLFGHID